MWTPPQRIVLACVVLALAGALGVAVLRNPVHLGDPLPDDGPRQHELIGRIDPNLATWAELAALPVVGEKKARDIVAYREQFARNHPGQAAFACPADLAQVKGIGPATIAAIEMYLQFPDPTTQP